MHGEWTNHCGVCFFKRTKGIHTYQGVGKTDMRGKLGMIKFNPDPIKGEECG